MLYLADMTQDAKKPLLVVLTGAGISAESGLKTFRDSGGLWEGHRVEDVATPEAWIKNPGLVLDFYNQRRKAANKAEPNTAHIGIAELEAHFEVYVITQNVDNLHERAGSSNVLHLHGELRLARSTANPSLIYPIEGDALNPGDVCELGSQLRPHIVWFGEAVPMIEPAARLVSKADHMAVIGTSLQVYPAAGLLQYYQGNNPVYLIDPNASGMKLNREVIHIPEKASEGIKKLISLLLTKPNT
jgi:NAD-dependent deacetylase